MWIANPEEHLDENWFDKYLQRRKEGVTNKLLSRQREKQYLIDSLFVKDYIKDDYSVLDVGCSNGKFLSIIGMLKSIVFCILFEAS